MVFPCHRVSPATSQYFACLDLQVPELLGRPCPRGHLQSNNACLYGRTLTCCLQRIPLEVNKNHKPFKRAGFGSILATLYCRRNPAPDRTTKSLAKKVGLMVRIYVENILSLCQLVLPDLRPSDVVVSNALAATGDLLDATGHDRPVDGQGARPNGCNGSTVASFDDSG